MKKIKGLLKKSFYALLILSILMVQIDFTFIYAESKEESGVEETANTESSQEENEATVDEEDGNQDLLDDEKNDNSESDLEKDENKNEAENDENKETEEGEGNTSKEDISKDENDEDEVVNETENEEIDSSIFTYDESGTIIIGFSGALPKDKIVFPREHNGKAIVGIADKAFEGKGIEGHITFPESYKEIGKWAFKGNQITSVDVKGIQLIEEGALENNNIKNLELEDVEELGPWAFAGNPLEKASGNKLKKIGENAFGGTSLDLNLTGELSSDLFSYDEDMKITGTYFPNLNLSGNSKFPVKTSGNIDITGIGISAFQGKEIEGHITFPETYERIEKWAFKANHIESITLEGETYIGEGAFEKNKLTELYLPKVEEIGPWAFEGNKIESINLPEVSTIGEIAFANNELSGELNLPNLLKIKDSAFQNNRIEKLNLPKLKEIGDYGFADNKLNKVTAPNLNILGEWALVGEAHKLKSLTINNKLTSVRLSSLYMANEEHLGNFPIYLIDSMEEENIIDSEHRIVYNPTDDFKEIYLESLDINQEYIWTSVDDFIMGTDRNNHPYYCVDHETPMKQCQ